MKRFIIVFLLLLILTNIGRTQCTINDIFAVEHGMNKFKVTTTLTAKKNIADNIEANRNRFNEWDKLDYLEGDSVFKSSLYYNFLSHPCFKGYENELHLKFVDDHLYNIRITLDFLGDSFEECIENYNELLAVLKGDYPNAVAFIQTDGRFETDEQVGEGYWLEWKTAEKDSSKIETLSIGYAIDYELKYDSYKNEYYKTGNVEKVYNPNRMGESKRNKTNE